MMTEKLAGYYCSQCGLGPYANLMDVEGHTKMSHLNPIALTLEMGAASSGIVRTFETGANRDMDTGKLDFEAFLSPSVLFRYAEFMHGNRFLRDGTMRDGDNWQKGIPLDVYMKSLARHFFAVWRDHRAGESTCVNKDELCAIMFNVMGYLHEKLKKEKGKEKSNE